MTRSTWPYPTETRNEMLSVAKALIVKIHQANLHRPVGDNGQAAPLLGETKLLR